MLENLITLLKTELVKIFHKKKYINNNIWIFSSSYNTQYNYNSKYLFEYVINNHKNILPLYVINDDDKRESLQKIYGYEHFIETKSIKGIKQALNAGVWLTSAGLPVYGFKLNKNRLIINLWHGVPLKKIALLEEKISLITKLYFKFTFSNNYSYIITTSNHLKSIMAKSFKVKFNQVKVLGQPRNDAIYNKNNREIILNKLYEALPEYNKIILYAPTYRDEGNTLFFPFKDFNEEKLYTFLKDNKIIIFLRAHQSETGLFDIDKYQGRIKLLGNEKIDDIMNIINIFDVLITDYSSIYIDYLLTLKPILFLPYDQEKYLDNRGLNFNYDNITPGPKPKLLDDFIVEIMNLLQNNQYYLNERKNINNYFNEIKIGASEEIIEFINSEIENF